MHQLPRPSSKAAAAAAAPLSNPNRANERLTARTPSNVDLTAYTERAGQEELPDRGRERAGSMANQEREQTKLNQIIQNFHTKAALTICSTRAELPKAYNNKGDLRQNRWFNLVLDDTDALLDDIQEWKRPDLAENRPVPLVIEVFVDAANCAANQALVITDNNGKRWDIADAVRPSSSRTASGSVVREVLLERWTVQLGDAEGYTSAQLNDQLPNVYKKAVVLFRSIYTYLRLLPTWKLHRRLGRQVTSSDKLRLGFRIKRGPQGRSSSRMTKESPFPPLCPSEVDSSKITVSHDFAPLLCPAGPLSISVQYRINCDLSVADSEALLSSRFAGLDAGLQDRYGKSLPGDRSQSNVAYGSLGAQPDQARVARVAGGGAYGSLGTFHAAGKRESPVSVLRQRALSQDEDAQESPARNVMPARRHSRMEGSDLLKNPPFKAGSYASSPKAPASPTSSSQRPSPFGSSVPKRLSINALPSNSLRPPSYSGEHAIASSGSTSPKPAPMHRYSSSFANRKRFTSQGSKADESTTSSGRGSTSSKERSEQLQEGSSGSGRTDEDDIAAFIGGLERAKNLPSFSTRNPASSNVINLTKFKGMGIASSELADEMSSSSLIQTSLTPPSRRLSNVPGLSTSSSPGRVLAHAPHVRSRLSTHSIAEERSSAARQARDAEDEQNSSDEEPFIFQQDNIL